MELVSNLSFTMFRCFLIQIFLFSSALGNDTDKLSLLAFKAKIIHDPLGIFNSWNESLHLCNWPGIRCGRRHVRVTMLDLQSSGLKGSLSPFIGNLSFLRTLNLQNNSFTNNIPPEFGRLRRLQILELSNNSLSGEIPTNISRCSNLQQLSLNFNNLTGKLPGELGSLSKLQILQMKRNNLVGEIPTSLGNLSSLLEFHLGRNSLHGGIPRSFGNLKSLTRLAPGRNHLTGTIPPAIYNLSNIEIFDVNTNYLEGYLPRDLGYTLPRLKVFLFHANQFSGTIPSTISNATNLRIFEIMQNNFVGHVPNLERLFNLERFGISINYLGHGEEGDLKFLSSLVNSSNLQLLGINDNNFGGVLPESISNYSTELRYLTFAGNHITGRIPTGIGELISLEVLGIEDNQLSGVMPSSIGKLQNLYRLSLHHNKLTGTIPTSLGNITSLSILLLSFNNLEGSIPSSLAQCKFLLLIGLCRNHLNGSIPREVIGMSSLSQTLDLAGNNLTGNIPNEVGKLVNLGFLALAENKLSGEIPKSLGNCISLEYLYLEGNLLEGALPKSLAFLKGIEEINLSRNNLSGKLPIYFKDFQFLLSLNLAFNDFEGEVPLQGVFKNTTAFNFTGNIRLCGGLRQLQLPKCPSRKHTLSLKLKLTISAVCILIVLISILFLIFVLYQSRKRSKSSLGSSTSKNSFLRLSYGDLLKATDGFSSENLIGVGSFGSVYKGILVDLEERVVVAVKVLNLHLSKAVKSFVVECETLKSIRHRNLVKLLTTCSSIDFQGNEFKALVYEYKAGGSLEEWLHGERILNLIQRVKIAIDVASALDYLHNRCYTPIVHCDLKPSNILLDNDLNASIGDFGLARFLQDPSHSVSSNQTRSIGLRGSIGYTAPEYGMGGEISTLGDVFSYGILLLEIFTGKRPTDGMFKDDQDLHNFAFMALPKHVDKILDPKLLLEMLDEDIDNDISKCLISIIEIGVSCSAKSPVERKNISNVVDELCRIRDVLIRTSTSTAENGTSTRNLRGDGPRQGQA